MIYDINMLLILITYSKKNMTTTQKLDKFRIQNS